MPREEKAVKLAGGNKTTKFFWMQPEYMNTGRIQVSLQCPGIPLWGHSSFLPQCLRPSGRSRTPLIHTPKRTWGLCIPDVLKQRRISNHPWHYSFQGQAGDGSGRGQKVIPLALQTSHLAKICPRKVPAGKRMWRKLLQKCMRLQPQNLLPHKLRKHPRRESQQRRLSSQKAV